MSQAELYQSVLKKLSDTSTAYLPQIDKFLSQLHQEAQNQAKNREKTLDLAGSWKDMSEEDFQDYLKQAKASGEEAFGIFVG